MTLHELSLAYDACELAKELEQLLTQEVTPAWFQQWSEIGNKVNDLYVASDWCFEINTADKTAEEHYKKFRQEGLPKIEEVWHKLTLRGSQFQTHEPRYQRIAKFLKLEHETSSAEAINLETRERELMNQFRKLSAQRTLTTDKPMTLIQAKSQLKTTQDNHERKVLWEAIQKRSMEDAPEVNSLFLELQELRNEKARVLGFPSYPAFIWGTKHREDYTPEYSLELLANVEKYFADAQQALKRFKAKTLGVTQLKPWYLDISFDLTATRTLSESDYLSIATEVLRKMSPDFSAILETMIKKGHIDIMSRPNKGTVNYATVLTRTDEPLVFVNCTGNPDNLKALFHELGHALHHAHLGPGKLYFEKSGPKEVNEFFAYVFQTLGAQTLIEMDYFTLSEKRSYQLGMLCNVLEMFEYISQVERFQHWVYAQEKVTAEDLDQYYLTLAQDSQVDWSGYETILGKQWQTYSVLSSPFYSIEYVISWLATLILMQKVKGEPEMVHPLREALSLGNTRTAAETFAVLGITFPFSKKEVQLARESLEELFMTCLHDLT
jgi:oligoendopeptidase F